MPDPSRETRAALLPTGLRVLSCACVLFLLPPLLLALWCVWPGATPRVAVFGAEYSGSPFAQRPSSDLALGLALILWVAVTLLRIRGPWERAEPA